MSTHITRSWLVLCSLSVLACAPPQLVCPDGFTLSAEGRCVTNDAGTVVPMGDGSVSPDAGSDAGSDAAMIAIDSGVPGVDAYVEGVDAFVPPPDAFVEQPDAYLSPDAYVFPDAYVAPDACAFGTWYVDADHDGYGSAASPISGCSQPAGTVSNATDCDDAAPTRHPGAPEVCNGIDDDCDGVADIIPTWYLDADGDGHGTALTHVQVCAMPSGYVASADDCDDSHASVHPGAPEICDGLRNDCTSAAPDAELLLTYYVDCDRDGFSASSTALTTCQTLGAPPTCSGGQYITSPVPTNASNTDCNDTDASSSPTTSWYPDCDGDNYVIAGAAATHSCTMPTSNACTTGTVSLPHGLWTHTPFAGADCWDFHGAAHPGSIMVSTTGYSTGVGTSYDWDCDGLGTPTITAVSPAATCTRDIRTGACNPSNPTWVGAIPGCGYPGAQYTCGGAACTPTQTSGVLPVCH